MEPLNPYSPPDVAQTTHTSQHETLFAYRSSTRNAFSVLLSVPLVVAVVFLIRSLAAYLLARPGAGLSGQVLIGVLPVILLAAALVALIMTNLIAPRIWEFHVDREFVTWRQPWPGASEQRIPVASIERVAYQATLVTITTASGERKPPPRSYGGLAEEVVEAIKAAVLEDTPRVALRERKQLDSISLMRRLGRLVGQVLRWLRIR